MCGSRRPLRAPRERVETGAVTLSVGMVAAKGSRQRRCGCELSHSCEGRTASARAWEERVLCVHSVRCGARAGCGLRCTGVDVCGVLPCCVWWSVVSGDWCVECGRGVLYVWSRVECLWCLLWCHSLVQQCVSPRRL